MNFRPPDDFWAWGLTACPSLDLETELEEFKTFWIDIATKNHKRTLRGWNATWKGRMKDRQEKTNGTNNGSFRKQREQSDADERNFFDNLRTEVNGSAGKLLEAGSPDSKRLV
jgi:hypothetical protein